MSPIGSVTEIATIKFATNFDSRFLTFETIGITQMKQVKIRIGKGK